MEKEVRRKHCYAALGFGCCWCFGRRHVRLFHKKGGVSGLALRKIRSSSQFSTLRTVVTFDRGDDFADGTVESAVLRAFQRCLTRICGIDQNFGSGRWIFIRFERPVARRPVGGETVLYIWVWGLESGLKCPIFVLYTSIANPLTINRQVKIWTYLWIT